MASANTEAAHDEARLVVTATCVVALTADGVGLVRNNVPWPIGYPELEVLATLSQDDPPPAVEAKDRAVQRSGAPEPELATFIMDLLYSGHLAQIEPIRHLEVSDHPAMGTSSRIELADPDRVRLPVPQTLRLRSGCFELLDHRSQRVATLDAREAAALATLTRPTSLSDALAALPRSSDGPVLTETEFTALVGRLDAAGVLRRAPNHDTAPVDREPTDDDPGPSPERQEVERRVFAEHAAIQTAAEQDRERLTGQRRVKVIPVTFNLAAPAALGSITAFAMTYDGGRLQDHYQFRTDWVWSDDRLEEFTAEPAVYLCSDYLWSHRQCLAVSAQVKALSPNSITIHGGPDAPKYENDATAYLEAHPYVDVLVRGEGEETAAEALAALLPVIGSPTPDLTVLDDVPGLTYRIGDRLVRTPDRERQADFSLMPSPILTGLFDMYGEIPLSSVTMETNRGCPYSCAFCDWGSATNSRIRKFDMDRITAELDWCARNQIENVNIADANFGIFERDVEVARSVAAAHRSLGFPRSFGVSYAKNTTKYLRQIISILSDAGILSVGVLSLQTMDPATLQTIRRSNIKTEKYDAIAEEMRKAHLPLMVELMMGLPGQTVASLADDLQECINRSVPARINMTTLLVNSPMNAPDYLAEHQIETAEPVEPGHNSVLVATRTYTRDDYEYMKHLRLSFMAYENFGMLRQVAMFLRQETSQREIDIYRSIHDLTSRHPNRWPLLTALDRYASTLMAPPHSWDLTMADLGRFAVEELGVAEGSALGSILATQAALLPAFGRVFPLTLHLDHDVVAWTRAVAEARASDPTRDWTTVVPRLETFGPGELTVDDLSNVCQWGLGIHPELNSIGVNWELDSPLARAGIKPPEGEVEASTAELAVAIITTNADQHNEPSSVPVTLGRK